jgi:hypothetical protein
VFHTRACRSLIILAILIAGCENRRERAKQDVRRIGEARLRKEVAQFYKNLYAEHRKTFTTVAPENWTPAFNEIKPLRITAYADGFAFCLERNGDAESGLYIIPLAMEHAPAPTAWASYERLSEGIYWYSFKP